MILKIFQKKKKPVEFLNSRVKVIKSNFSKDIFKKCAELCNQVYMENTDVLIDTISFKGYSIIAIEGTDESRDWLKNLQIITVDGRHAGFNNNSFRIVAMLALS